MAEAAEDTDFTKIETKLNAQEGELVRKMNTTKWVPGAAALGINKSLSHLGGIERVSVANDAEEVELDTLDPDPTFQTLSSSQKSGGRDKNSQSQRSSGGNPEQGHGSDGSKSDTTAESSIVEEEEAEQSQNGTTTETATGEKEEGAEQNGTQERATGTVTKPSEEEKEIDQNFQFLGTTKKNSWKMSHSPTPDYDSNLGSSKKPKSLASSTRAFGASVKSAFSRKNSKDKESRSGLPPGAVNVMLPEKGSSANPSRPWTSDLRKAKITQPKVVDIGSMKMEDVEDLSQLPELNLETVTTCLRARFQKDRIYTKCGNILISVNPFKETNVYTDEICSKYTQEQISPTPHLYSISAHAYRSLRENTADQVILVSGESGAGKTEATKYLVQHLVTVAGSESETLHDKIIQINPLLESFGNARTNLNANSSRFAKFLHLDVNRENGKLYSARVRDYMLEKSRVTHHGSRERTFHSFYALLVGADDKLLEQLYLDRKHEYRITSLFRADEHAFYRKVFQEQHKVFKLIDLDDEEIQEVYNTLAAILLIGEIEFVEQANDSVTIKNEDIVLKISNLLGVDLEKLTVALIQRRGRVGKAREESIRDESTVIEVFHNNKQLASTSRGTTFSPLEGSKRNSFLAGDFIEFSKNKKQAEDERDALAKSLYERLFGWLVKKINQALKPQRYRSKVTIGILDICGFENLDENSFEQLLINLVNEKLQNFMNSKVIEEESQLYLSEGIDIGDIDAKAVNNDDILTMFFKEREGILFTIDENSKVDLFNDKKLVDQMAIRFAANINFIKPQSNRPEFSIKHFAGVVSYSAENFILKNKDTFSDLMHECMTSNMDTLVGHLFKAPESEYGSISMSVYDFPDSRRPTSRRPRLLSESVKLGVSLSETINRRTQADLKKKFGDKPPAIWKTDSQRKVTVLSYFRNSLAFLLKEMRDAEPYFIRCIKPNDSQKPGIFEKRRVQTQLRYNGITEVARIRTCGFPYRMPVGEFLNRYMDISAKKDYLHGPELCLDVMTTVRCDEANYKVGNTQVFMKEDIRLELDEVLIEVKKRLEEERKRREEEERKRKEEEERKKKEEEAKLGKLEASRRRKEDERKRQEDERKKQEEQIEEEVRLRDRASSSQEGEGHSLRDVSPEVLRSRHLLDLELERLDEDSGGVRMPDFFMQSSIRPRSTTFKPELETIIQEASIRTSFSGIYNSTHTSRDSSNQSDQTIPKTVGSGHITFVAHPEEEDSESGDDADKQPTEPWDRFISLEEEDDSPDVHEQPVLMVLKVLVYVILFIIIFASLVCHKVSLMLLIGNVNLTFPKIVDGEAKKHRDSTTLSSVYLMIAMCIPSGLAFLISMAKFCFGSFKSPGFWTWIVVIFSECLHTFGLVLLVFRVLPNIDTVRGTMLLNATAVIPAFLKLAMAGSRATHRRCVRSLVDFFAFCCQASAIPLIVLFEYLEKNPSKAIWTRPWDFAELIATFVLVSIGHWENFVDGRFFCCDFSNAKANGFNNAILKVRYELQKGRHLPNMVAYILNIGVVIGGAYLLMDTTFDYPAAFDNMSRAYNTPKTISAIITVTISACVAFFAVLAALSFDMQVYSFTIPALLTTPAVVGLFHADCEYGFLQSVTTLETACPKGLTGDYWYHTLFAVAWWVSLLVLTRHLWRPEIDRTANMDRLFMNPAYCGVLCTESIMLNRRRQLAQVVKTRRRNDDGVVTNVQYRLAMKNPKRDTRAYGDAQSIDAMEQGDFVEYGRVNPEGLQERRDAQTSGPGNQEQVVPMLYSCATMWHETRTEMVQLLKSIHRIDMDQFVRRVENMKQGKILPDFYNYEAHILFDDAMELDDFKRGHPNKFVKDLMKCIGEACSSVAGKQVDIHDPIKVITPYGGQLIWQMPGQNLLYVHLKDIRKIRNRKRWSQVMYMYYLLGYRLFMLAKKETTEQVRRMNRSGHMTKEQSDDILLDRLDATANNTFLLALDGDTDFSPGAVKILMDRMKDEKVGAACGRIHPIGSGPLIWYQKFEYAIGHWLQKAAEHVFGCVLCSPGCFSLFRASALMKSSVMKKYTTEPSEAAHHLQFDQGEDRWLCTLLLQAGYRIEYAAAADAYTYAPEGFSEFYNQRRRWMPSTIANILDLLNSSKKTTKINPNISTPYIFYQWLLMVMTILGPGTVLMMIAGAMRLVFEMDLLGAYLLATVPAMAFTMVCFWCKQKIQLLFASVLSVVYSFVMMVVFVGTLYTASTEDVFHPSVIVIVLLILIFTLAGIAHPYEIGCLAHAVLYMMVIPSGYLLLVIYSIVNLNDVSWGTREVLTKAQIEENKKRMEEKKKEKEAKKQKGILARVFGRGEEHLRELTNLVKTLVPERANASHLVKDLEAGTNNSELMDLLKKIEENTRVLANKEEGSEQGSLDKKKSLGMSRRNREIEEKAEMGETQLVVPTTASAPAEPAKPEEKEIIERPDDPFWVHFKPLGKGKTTKANKEEWEFWDKFVKKYLLPIKPTKEQKAATANELRELRNSASFGLIIVNLLWMALNFMFQYREAAKITIAAGTSHETEESALGLLFVAVLLFLMLIQLIGMFIHRLGTLRHLLAVTEIRIRRHNDRKNVTDESNLTAALRSTKMLLREPCANDPGTHTEPPETIAEGENAWGQTVAPSASRRQGSLEDTARFRRSLAQSMSGFGRLVEAHRGNEVLSRQDAHLMRNISLRMAGEELARELEGRPALPPRGRSKTRLGQSRRIGFTTRDLQDLGVDVGPPETSRYEEQYPADLAGALGRSLFHRARIVNDAIRETQGPSQNDWNGLFGEDHSMGNHVTRI